MQPPNTLLRHGRYRIIQRIGQGGMGAVYVAQALTRPMALYPAQRQRSADLM